MLYCDKGLMVDDCRVVLKQTFISQRDENTKTMVFKLVVRHVSNLLLWFSLIRKTPVSGERVVFISKFYFVFNHLL